MGMRLTDEQLAGALALQVTCPLQQILQKSPPPGHRHRAEQNTQIQRT